MTLIQSPVGKGILGYKNAKGQVARFDTETGDFVKGQHHFEEEDFYEVCPVCGWEDDGLQRDNPDYAGGANRMSLNEAKVAYREGREIE